MNGLSVVVELQPQLFLEPTTGCFVTGFDCYERIKAGLFFGMFLAYHWPF
jgi:hypothetical protein